MDDKIKNRLIIILGILTVIFLAAFVTSCNNSQRNRSDRDKEMLNRMNLEEKMNKFGQERQTLEKKLDAIAQELNQEKAMSEATKKELLQERAVAASLRDELAKVTKLNANLQKGLQEALASEKAPQIKK